MLKAPKKTSVYKKETAHEKYEILFAPELVKSIKEKKKWRTYRFGDKYDYLQVGDKVDLKDYEADQIICKAKIVDKKWTTFEDLPLNLSGHEEYESKDEQRRVFSGYYAYLGREIRDDDPFLMIEFELE